MNDVEELGVVDLVDGAVGAEGAELLLDAVVDEGGLEAEPVLADERDEGGDVDVGDDLDVPEVVGDAVLGDAGDAVDGVRLRPDAHLVHVRDERQHAADARVRHRVQQRAVLHEGKEHSNVNMNCI